MEYNNVVRSQKGFTLVEIIAVLILLGILAAVAIPKYIDMTSEAKDKAIDAAIAELNSRESMVWGKVKLSGWSADSDVTGNASYDTSLGSDYSWASGDPTSTGGDLSFQSGTAVTLTRTPSTATSPGRWSR